MRLIQAKLGQAVQANEIVIQAARRLQKMGSLQWAGRLNGEDINDIERKIINSEVYFYVDENEEIAGLVYACKKQLAWDKQLWGENNTENIHYIHRVAIADRFTGQKLGKAMMEAMLAFKGPQGITLRLDCLADNVALNTLYQRVGFHFVKRIKDHNTGDQIADFNLYQWSANK